MPESSLNQILADNLALHMEKKGLKQMALAKKCGVGQTTISLYLSPDRRKPGKDGKAGSAKLTEVEMLGKGPGSGTMGIAAASPQRQSVSATGKAAA